MSFPCYVFSDAALLQVRQKNDCFNAREITKPTLNFWFAYVQPSAAKTSPNWPFQNLPPSGGTSWTSPYATKPVVYIAIGGVRSGANLDIDQLGYWVEPTDISETGFSVTIRRTHGLLYDVAVNWIAFGPKRP